MAADVSPAMPQPNRAFDPGERVHDRVVVRADEQPVALEVVAGVDDDGEAGADGRLEPACEPRPADAAGELDDPPGRPAHGRASSAVRTSPIRSIVSLSYGRRHPDDDLDHAQVAIRPEAVGDRGGRAEQDGHVAHGRDPVVGELGLRAPARASAGSSRTMIGKLTVLSIRPGSRPTAAAVLGEDRVLGRDLLERPARVPGVGVGATVRSVFCGPEPPIRIGRWAWIGVGAWTAS